MNERDTLITVDKLIQGALVLGDSDRVREARRLINEAIDYEPCVACDAHGWLVVDHVICLKCEGSGRILTQEERNARKDYFSVSTYDAADKPSKLKPRQRRTRTG